MTGQHEGLRGALVVSEIALALVLPLTLTAPAFAADDGALCPNPTQLEGFKTCADVAKAEEEGEVVIYSTNPEAGEAKVLAVFNKMFPKIKTNYVPLQAGALFAKVLAERQAGSSLADILQLSDMGMVLDFQKKAGYLRYVSPEMAAYKGEYKSEPVGHWTWGAVAPAGLAYNPNLVTAGEAPKTPRPSRRDDVLLHMPPCGAALLNLRIWPVNLAAPRAGLNPAPFNENELAIPVTGVSAM